MSPSYSLKDVGADCDYACKLLLGDYLYLRLVCIVWLLSLKLATITMVIRGVFLPDFISWFECVGHVDRPILTKQLLV